MKRYAYLRVSTILQNEARQLIALRAYEEQHSAPIDRIFLDKMSGKDFERPQYKRMVAKLKKGDLLIVKSLDRLGRSYAEILEQWRLITKEKGADIVVMDMPILDTRFGKDLVGTLITDLVLSLLSFMANMEYDYIKTRTAEGIAAAKARGVRFGRPSIERGDEYNVYLRQWKNGEISARGAAQHLSISHTTFLRWAKESNDIDEHDFK